VLGLLQLSLRKQQTLFDAADADASQSVQELFGVDGLVTEAMSDLIRSGAMAMSLLDEEVAALHAHSNKAGNLARFRKAKFLFDESRLLDLVGQLRGQCAVLTTLQVTLDLSTLPADVRRKMRRHRQDVRSVYAESETASLGYGRRGEAPKYVADAESILSEETGTIPGSVQFDFDGQLKASGPYRNMRSRSPLAVQSSPGLAAVLAGDLAGVVRVLQDGLDPNTVDTGGLTLMRRCADVTTTEVPRIVSALVSHGADLDAHRPNTGPTPLRFAVMRDNLRVVKVLVGLGAEVTVADRIGQQAIHVAVQLPDPAVATCLLIAEAGGKVDVAVLATMLDEQDPLPDKDCTLLHFASG
jgi:hypothetical protein